MTRIVEVTEYSERTRQEILLLLRQLTTRPIEFSEATFRRLLSGDTDTHLFLLLADEAVAGMLTTGIYLSPTGSKAWIEDVVVSDSFRGRGFGKLLVNHALDYLRARGIDEVLLTSKPQRIAANALYRSLGFETKETNLYKLSLKG